MIHIATSLSVVLLLVFTLGSCSEKKWTSTNATRQARVNHQQQQTTNNQVGFCTAGNNGAAGGGGVCMTRMACSRGGGTQLGLGGCGTYNICCDGKDKVN